MRAEARHSGMAAAPSGLLTVDGLWAAGSVSWALAALTSGHVGSPVGVTVVALNLVVAVLFVRREGARAVAPWWQALLAAGCVVMGAVALAQAPEPAAFPWWASGVFALAGVGAIWSLWTLGRSFSVLPARRTIVASGPYRLVRHPVYACELLMVAACCAAGGGWRAYWPLALTLLLVVVRIGLEERLLACAPAYRAYCAEVPRRLVLGVW